MSRKNARELMGEYPFIETPDEESNGTDTFKHIDYVSALEVIYSFAEQECKLFGKWLEQNYRTVRSRETGIFRYVNLNCGIMNNGSDYHYNKLVKENGKTIDELYTEFRNLNESEVNKLTA